MYLVAGKSDPMNLACCGYDSSADKEQCKGAVVIIKMMKMKPTRTTSIVVNASTANDAS